MDIYMPMSTTRRHNEFISTLVSRIFPFLEKREVTVLHEERALVYWGTRKISNGFNLVDTTHIDDENNFIENILPELDYVQPDFVVFKNNPFLENIKQTKTAGQPDLIVEIWSEGNTRNDRAFLQNLYATSGITEHWYIEQDSNEVSCYYGMNRIENQYLTDILVTREGLQFDLRYLAI
ncbi:MAG: Uma2 family endonuclease [Oscillospiraceae bacterium]|nr:Uma2 family endonuclease [Oscillospiraceae bacterium]